MYQYLPIYLLATLTGDIAHAAAAQLADCFLPNGTAVPLSAAYQPCISTQNVHSMCCVLNATALETLGESADKLDTCLTNGLCQTSQGGWARDLCTDKTWTSPNCVNVCTSDANGGNPTGESFLTACSDGSWCCGGENNTCCNDNLGFQIPKSIGPYSNVATSATATGSTVPGPVSTGTGSGTSSASSTNRGVEIGVGAALGAVLLAVAILWIFRCRKRMIQRRRDVVEPGNIIINDSKIGFPGELHQDNLYHEAPNGISLAEMDGRT